MNTNRPRSRLQSALSTMMKRTEILDNFRIGNGLTFLANERLRVNWISFDSLLYDPDSDLVYLGITSFNADIFRAYDRKSDKFLDLGYANIADPFDAKFHRSLVKSQDGNIYGAIALLHDVDNYWNAPGGAIVKYYPKNGDMLIFLPL